MSNKKLPFIMPPDDSYHFSGRFSILLTCALSLTGITSVAGLFFLLPGIKNCIWQTIGIAAFSWKVLLYLSVICWFAALVKIAINKKPFSKMLSLCTDIIGVLFLAASILFPRFPDYKSSGFEIFSYGDFVLIDGMILLPGLLLLFLSMLFKEGEKLQQSKHTPTDTTSL